jgi:hypothetical protein
MPDKWDFVDSWLDGVLDSHRLKTPSLKSASISPQDSITRIAQRIALSSPPPSIRPRRPSYTPPSASNHPSLKRKRYALSNSYNGSTMPSPRKRTRNQDDQLSTTATSALNDIQLTPTVHSRSSSPTKVKATSPVRELRVIYRFASPPLKFTSSVDENTPQSIVDMVRGLPLHGVGVIPGSLKVRPSLCPRTRASRQVMTDTLRKPSKQPCLLKIFPTTLSMTLHLATAIRTSGEQLQTHFREQGPVSSTTGRKPHGW